MKNIRTFILSCSAVLSCWLAASYAYQPELVTAESSSTALSQIDTASEGVERPKEKTAPQVEPRLTTMATIQE
ncbi:MAG: hypothetical protein P8P36_00920 [Akkermansiaceae bacterium]|nr:hypothetical protein [Akkermansiaceae bacterium]